MEKTLKFRQSKGNYSAITNDTLIKPDVHNFNMPKHIQYRFHEIPSIVYLGMAEDRKSDKRTEWLTTPNQYPSAFGGG